MTGGYSGDHERTPGKRKDVSGWSKHSTRRFQRKLISVNPRRLDGLAFAVTLTVRDCPATPDDWHKSLNRFWQNLRRSNSLKRAIWQAEWQERQVPHLHLYLALVPASAYHYKKHIWHCWKTAAYDYRPGWKGFHCDTINNLAGWFAYLLKHTRRGVKHYQRSAENIPPAWRGRTGRMWGFVGDWDGLFDEPISLCVKSDTNTTQAEVYKLLRRVIRSYLVASVRWRPYQWFKVKTLFNADNPFGNPQPIYAKRPAEKTHRKKVALARLYCKHQEGSVNSYGGFNCIGLLRADLERLLCYHFPGVIIPKQTTETHQQQAEAQTAIDALRAGLRAADETTPDTRAASSPGSPHNTRADDTTPDTRADTLAHQRHLDAVETITTPSKYDTPAGVAWSWTDFTPDDIDK